MARQDCPLAGSTTTLELEGFLERDADRLYTLSVLGRKAVATLNFINEDIDIANLETVNSEG